MSVATCAWCGNVRACSPDREGDPTCAPCLALPDEPARAPRSNVIDLAQRRRARTTATETPA